MAKPRPADVETMAWLCSEQAGCISAIVRNVPKNLKLSNAYVPIIMSSSP